MATGLLLDTDFSRHDPGPHHPEAPGRIFAIAERLAESGLPDRCTEIAKRVVTDDEIRRVHDARYLETVLAELSRGKSGQLSTGDTQYSADTLAVARAAAGGMLAAVDGVISGQFKNAFCAVRPPGHHATPNRGMGFCVFNTIAIAARQAQAIHGVERVAIVDWDVHHGNGTQDCFYDDGSVFFFSTHQHPWYPGTGARVETGEGSGKGTTMNAPLPAGTGMERVGAAFGELEKELEAYKPDLILVSAGFDSRQGDPLGDFRLSDDDFVELTNRLLALADHHASGRLVSVLEGGYNQAGLAVAVEHHLGSLLAASAD
ncbi:MAG: histone deacetylase [Verrucomicrobiota bacterium]